MSKRLDAAIEWLDRVIYELGLGDDDPEDAKDKLATWEDPL